MRSGYAAIGTLVLAACSVPSVDLIGKQCPCPSDLACDATTNTCQPIRLDGGGADVPRDVAIDAPPCDPSFVRSSTAGGVIATAGTVTFSTGNTNGDVVFVAITNGATTTDPVLSVSDAAGNNYTRVDGRTEQDDNNNAYYEVWSAPMTSATAASNTITVVPAPSGMFATEYSCVALDNALDTVVGLSHVGGPYSITCAESDELIVTISVFQGSGQQWTVNGTNRSGSNNRIVEYDDLIGVEGANSISVSTSSGAKPGSVSLAFRPQR